jgi:hypothetical protein
MSATAAHPAPTRAGSSGTRGLPGFILVMFAWQAGLCLAYANGGVEFALFVTIHVAGCCALVAWLSWQCRAASLDTAAYSAALQVVGWTALAGPFGALVSLALALSLPADRAERAGARRVSEDRAHHSQLGPAERLHQALRDSRIHVDGAQKVRPLRDVIAEGSQPEKLETLGVLYRKFGPDLAFVLKEGLRAPDTSVRVLAATVTAKLHATFTRRIGDHQAITAAGPETAAIWLQLAEARLAYAQSGMLEQARARAEIELAIGDLVRACELAPDDRQVSDRLEDARRCLEAERGSSPVVQAASFTGRGR